MNEKNIIRGNAGASPQAYTGDALTLRVVFKFNGLATAVLNPVLRIRNVDRKKDVPYKALGSFPTKKDRTEWSLVSATETMYTIQLDPLSLEPGFWTLKFEGTVSTGSENVKVSIDGALELDVLSRAGRIAHQIMAEMTDTELDEFFAVNGNYNLFKPSALYAYISDGVDWFNATGPTLTSYTMETFPERYEFMLKRYVRSQDALRRARVAIETDLQLSDSAHSLSQQKFEKYKGLYTMLMTEAKESVVTAKTMTPGKASTFIRNLFVVNYLGCSTGISLLYMGSYGTLPQNY